MALVAVLKGQGFDSRIDFACSSVWRGCWRRASCSGSFQFSRQLCRARRGSQTKVLSASRALFFRNACQTSVLTAADLFIGHGSLSPSCPPSCVAGPHERPRGHRTKACDHSWARPVTTWPPRASTWRGEGRPTAAATAKQHEQLQQLPVRVGCRSQSRGGRWQGHPHPREERRGGQVHAAVHGHQPGVRPSRGRSAEHL